MNPTTDAHDPEIGKTVEPDQAREICAPGLGTALGSAALGLGALLWILLRSGFKPSRLSYPCQQSALTLALATTGTPVGACLAARHRCGGTAIQRAVIFLGALFGIGAVVLFMGSVTAWYVGAGNGPVVLVSPPGDYFPDVFLVNDARGVHPGRFGGMDDLVTLMGAAGQKLYRSVQETAAAGPTGLVAVDAVVLLKINAQWSQRGGTNTDVLRGLIRCLVEHPDGYVGEIVVADNGQGSGNLTRAENNADDISQSPQTVANAFAAEGWSVSTALWDSIRHTRVGEYVDGDLRDGYVVESTPDPESAVRVSYPKFRTQGGRYLSYKRGVWSPELQEYDPQQLVVINMPVLKTHSIYGVTAAVKNHMGVVTQAQSTDSHNGVARGGLGTIMAEVRMPALTILDCIWVLARPGSGPAAPYSNATRMNRLVAGTDPVALDAWAVKHVLIPQIIANGYTYAHYGLVQDPDNAESTFRRYLDRSLSELLLAGIMATNQYHGVRLHSWSCDVDADGDLDLTDFSLLGGCVAGPAGALEPRCRPADFDLDGATDMKDVSHMQRSFTGKTPSPP